MSGTLVFVNRCSKPASDEFGDPCRFASKPMISSVPINTSICEKENSKMKTLRFVGLIALVLVAIGATYNNENGSKSDFFSVLTKGQVVTVKEVAGKYELLIVKQAPIGSKVIEIGTDYVVVEDAAGVMETRIHVASIKCINRLKLPRE